MSKLKSITALFLLAAMLPAAVSCEKIFDNEGDCSPKVQFIFKKHRQALHSVEGREFNAFYSEVETLHLFVYDAATGALVFETVRRSDELHSAAELNIGPGADRCYLPVDLKPGRYRFVAWCGLDSNDSNNAFSLGQTARSGQYTHCSVKREAETQMPVHEARYESLYHGMTVAEVTYGSAQGRIIPVELTKDTNDIAVWVQHTTKTFGEDDYEVVYTDANGSMRFEDNSMADDSRLEYRAYATSLLTADTQYNGQEMKTGALVAHISTSRLMASHRDARLEVRSKEGQTVFSIPFIEYVLELQTFTSNGQYYLDCEDTYNCSFYLSTKDDGTWTPFQIIINTWVVVPKQSDDI